MSRTIPFGRLGDVPVRIGPSWLVVLPVLGLALYLGIDGSTGPTWERMLLAAAGSVTLLLGVMAHEVGHAIVAVHRGIRVNRIVVFLLGGYSEIDLDGSEPRDEIVVSAAGPIASFVVAGLLWALSLFTTEAAGAQQVVRLLVVVNVWVAVFNLLPGLPLDGGRIVRAWLVSLGTPRPRADVVTARLGMGLGALLIVATVIPAVVASAASLVMLPVGVVMIVLAVAAHPPRRRSGTLPAPPDDAPRFEPPLVAPRSGDPWTKP